MLGKLTNVHLLVKLQAQSSNNPHVSHCAQSGDNILLLLVFLETGVAKWERQEKERPLENKLKQLGEKKKVKENAAALNELKL